MKYMKLLISTVVLAVMISSSIGVVFASSFSGYLSVEFDKTTANVGDTVTMTVTASNEGLDSWYPVKIYAPIPSGMQYVSHVVPDKTLQNYNPGSGIWDVNRMRHDERGHLKTLIITLKVLPEAAGETIRGYTSFQTLMIEGTGKDLLASGEVPNSRTATINIEAESEPEDLPEDPPVPAGGPGNGPGDGIGNGSGSGVGRGCGVGLDLLTRTGGGGGNNGQAYEVFNSTDPTEDPQNTLYGLAALLLMALIFLGYLYGAQKKTIKY
jgi:uncharacterized repeat protein (TIGR01451 family)